MQFLLLHVGCSESFILESGKRIRRPGLETFLEAIEEHWRSSLLAALCKSLHLRLAALEPLLAMSEAAMARSARAQVFFALVTYGRSDHLVDLISLAQVF